MTADGVIVIVAQRFRTQERNREDARERLFEMIRKAAVRPRIRRATRPTLASKKRRLESKSRRATVKKMRGSRPGKTRPPQLQVRITRRTRSPKRLVV